MLNKDGQRELAYVVKIDDITSINGYDRVELAHVGGWTIVVGKNEFQPGDLAIYFEIDSLLPAQKPFTDMEFLVKKKFKIKTQKMCGVFSQGLLMSAANFNGELSTDDNDITYLYIDGEAYSEGAPMTEKLGVKYYVKEDNARKAKSVDKYKKMAQRRGKKANTPMFKWLYKRDWGKKLLFFLYGNKKVDGGLAWPSHICTKTDVDRLQNMTWLLNDKQHYVATEKVDGSSFTAAVERGRFGRLQYYVCSRNIVFTTGKENCFYDTNIYTEMFEKHGLKEILARILNDYKLENVAIQAEIYGEGVQKRDYSIKEHRIAVFHIVTNRQKYPMDKVVEVCDQYELPHVPIVDEEYVFPDTIEEVQEFVEGAPSKLDNKMREGIVFYDKKTGHTYTKFVSPKYLMKFH